jgi:hypothetical protein
MFGNVLIINVNKQRCENEGNGNKDISLRAILGGKPPSKARTLA